MELLSTTVELLTGLVALLILTQLLGKTNLSQITPFDFISALILGELVGNAIYDQEARLGHILYSVTLWGILIYLIEWLTGKFRGTRKYLEGSPSIIIRDGQLDREEMKKNKLDMNQLQNLLRKASVFSVREVAYAILEIDGSVNVLKKSDYDQPTNSDIHLPPKDIYLPITFINDGEVDWENLTHSGFNEIWLMNELRKHDIEHFEDVFYLEWKEDEGVHLQKM